MNTKEGVKTMKYYLSYIEVRIGEYEERVVIKFKTEESPDAYTDTIARFWYDLENDGEDKLDEWYWHNGEVIVRAGAWEEVTEDFYKTIPYFISEMDANDLIEQHLELINGSLVKIVSKNALQA